MTEPAPAGWDCHVHVFAASAPVRDGHYRPVDRPLAQIEATAEAHGVRHLVLVQPSVYGSDNTLLLDALATEPGRHRGVVVVDDTVTDAELDAMHAAGVRGVRLNRVSPVGDGADPARRFDALAPRLRPRGWHLQWYTDAAQLPAIAALHRDSGVTCVLDHLAGFGLAVPDDHPAWRAAEALAAGGAWLKLSGWYRLGAQAPYAGLVPRIRRLAAWFGERMVWGSDWPHTTFAPEAMPPYAQGWQPVVDALGPGAARALRGRPPSIYR
ncbi:amidohydrolase [Aquabacterium sp. J223]|uniref:amidohydrolase family protein n=1 Tax=Aquabacterium sp. J223 TaxID=2898431 RepID=UPI0021AD7B07|nr:amidohydrolase family protein [Aquabacterium sp. J223]UUX96996.1 amidohydrolase family protein [Aquabacterium sp. J223]